MEYFSHLENIRFLVSWRILTETDFRCEVGTVMCCDAEEITLATFSSHRFNQHISTRFESGRVFWRAASVPTYIENLLLPPHYHSIHLADTQWAWAEQAHLAVSSRAISHRRAYQRVLELLLPFPLLLSRCHRFCDGGSAGCADQSGDL